MRVKLFAQQYEIGQVILTHPREGSRKVTLKFLLNDLHTLLLPNTSHIKEGIDATAFFHFLQDIGFMVSMRVGEDLQQERVQKG